MLTPALSTGQRQRARLLPVPLWHQNHQVVRLDVFNLELAKVEQIREQVALRERQVLVSQIVEVGMD